MTPWPPLVVAIGLGCAGVAGLATLIPSPSEHVGLMMRDGALIQAGIVNERLLAARPSSPVLLYHAYLLRSDAGDIDGATRAAERLAAVSGGEIEALRVLAEHYFHIGEMEKRLDVFLSADPGELTDDEREKLVGGLRYAARYAEERGVLARLADAGLLSVAQSGRLGMLLAATDDRKSAIPHLSAFDDSTTVPAIHERLTLLHLLLEQDRTDEARQRAGRWHILWDDPQVSMAMTDAFEEAGQTWP